MKNDTDSLIDLCFYYFSKRMSDKMEEEIRWKIQGIRLVLSNVREYQLGLEGALQ